MSDEPERKMDCPICDGIGDDGDLFCHWCTGTGLDPAFLELVAERLAKGTP